MAHFIVEYSANLAGELDVPGLLRAVGSAVEDTGVFPLGGVRLRAVRCDDYLVADGDPANAFVHMTCKMGHGRPIEVRREAGRKIFEAMCRFLDPVYAARPLGISFEMVELHDELNFKKNNLHDYLKRRQQGRADAGG
jgi:5-carboxymethyl-2-hydroxymuconate isomerase